MSRAEAVHQQFIDRVNRGDWPDFSFTNAAALSHSEQVGIVESQFTSRLLDIVSRRLSAKRQSFYTIGSAGHEGNAAIASAFRINDPAFLHYRSCAFAIERGRKVPGSTPIYDAMLAFVASRDDPISGGRHKVIGSRKLWIPPQTSTIASHLPKAVGCAHAIGLYPQVHHEDIGLSHDSIVLCSFGDASINHSTAQGAFNTAAWARYQLSPMPIVFICEDNGIGISTPTPKRWVETNFSDKSGFEYIRCDGRNYLDVARAAQRAEKDCRSTRRPVFLHMECVRLMGHAGSDIESSYRERKSISDTEALDPLLTSSALLETQGILSRGDIVALYCDLEQRVEAVAQSALTRPKLRDAKDVKQHIWPVGTGTSPPLPKDDDRRALFYSDQRHFDKKIPMVRHINLALADLLLRYQNAVVLGEDVAKKGGVYGATQGLLKKFGRRRVMDTLLDEQSILGTAIGLAHAGFLPIAEIQYLAYLHNAEDQLRGEAATLAFFSQNQFHNGMVVRIAGYAYQKGFGGHFHNDNSLGVLRDIPGIHVLTPSSGSSAAQCLRYAVDLAQRHKQVVVIVEPIALYPVVDLIEENDGRWSTSYEHPKPNTSYAPITKTRSGEDCTLLSFGNGHFLCEQAAAELEVKYGLLCEVLNIQQLHPLPLSELSNFFAACTQLVVVDECRRSGSISEGIFAHILETCANLDCARITAEDCFIPLGEAAYHVLPCTEKIVKTVRMLHSGLKECPP